MRITILGVSVLALLLLCVIPQEQLSGGGSNDETSVGLTGRLLQPDGKTPAQGARVILRPYDYLSPLPILEKQGAVADQSVRTTTTDTDGWYCFDSVHAGIYCIEGRDAGNGLAAFIDSVKIDSNELNGTMTIATRTLMPVGIIRDSIPWLDGSIPAYLRVFGLDVSAESDSNGIFTIANVPEGKIRLRFSVIQGGVNSIDTTVVARSDSVVVIKWMPMHTVTFNDQSAETRADPAVVTVIPPKRTIDVVPESPVKKGCRFGGWYTNVNGQGIEFTNASIIASNMTVYAKWTMIDVDGNEYITMTMGRQTWMMENLRTTKYNDGTAIPLLSDKEAWTNCTTTQTPGYCCYGNDTSKKDSCGALYNWYAVNTGKLAPAGWHVPVAEDWLPYIVDPVQPMWNATCGAGFSCGFPATYCGIRLPDGSFNRADGYTGTSGNWWCSTQDTASNAWASSLFANYFTFSRIIVCKSYGFNVRLVRD
jgi:uncharacterized protein (TIGR02145 family)